MCQPKDKGGARCLAHNPVTKFLVRVIGLKTGASPEVIKQAIKELYKEGKKLEMPSVAEVERWIDTKRFATEIDPSLDDHERKIQLNQLDRAKEEIQEHGVKGGAWHVWKNLQKTVSTKMKSMRKAALAVGLIGAMSFGVAGCAGGLDKGDSTPKPSSTSTSQPATTEAPAVQTLGDVVTKTDANGAPVTVTDDKGTYQRVTLSPDDDAMKLNPANVDASVAAAGWSEADTLSGQQFIAKFVSEEGVDSNAVDSTSGWEKWKSEQSASYVAPEWSNMVSEPSQGSDRSAFITNNPNESGVPLIRDGSPRVASSSVSVDKVSSMEIGGANNLVVSGKAVTQYRVTDATMLASWQANNPDATKEAILKEKPELADGKDGTYTSTFDFMYSVRPDAASGWLITGYQNNFATKF